MLTIVGTLYNFSTKVSVVPDLASEGPSFIQFILTNESYLPIHEVSDSCEVLNVSPAIWNDKLQEQMPKNNPGGLGSLSIRPGEAYVAQTLSANEKRSINCPLPTALLKFPIERANIEVVIDYRPDWLPWKQKKTYRFEGYRNKDGNLVWLPPRM